MSVFKRWFRMRGGYVPHWTRWPLHLLIWKPIRKFLNVVVIPIVPFSLLRIWLYRLIGYRIGRHVFIGMRCYLDDTDPKRMRIGSYVTISYGTYFALHGIEQDGPKTIEICDGSYLGTRCTVITGNRDLRVGRNCLVGAGTLLLRSLPDHAVAVGHPARVIRYNDNVLSRRFRHHLGEEGMAELMSTRPTEEVGSAKAGATGE